MPETRARSWGLLVVLLGLIALAVLAREGRLPRPFRPVIKSALATADTRTIGPGQYLHWEFELPERLCQVTGRITGADSTRDRFYAAVMGDADFRRFAVDHGGNVFWEATAADATLQTTLQGPGRFHLVVSNHFSATERKTVTTTAAVACP